MLPRLFCSWVLVLLFYVCHGCVGLNQICRDRFESIWPSRSFIWLQRPSLPLFQWLLVQKKLDTVCLWFYQVFPFILSSLHGKTNQSGSKTLWVSTIPNRILLILSRSFFMQTFGIVCISNVLPFWFFFEYFFFYWAHFKWKTYISLLGGITQTLQKVMLVVRPKTNQTKVFVNFFYFLFTAFRILVYSIMFDVHCTVQK